MSIQLICTRKYHDLELNSVVLPNKIFTQDNYDRVQQLINANVAILDKIDNVEYDKSKKLLCIHYEKFFDYGGIETCILALSKYLSEYYNIIVTYTNPHDGVNSLYKISKYAKVQRIDKTPIECDTCITCSVYTRNIKMLVHAKKYIRWFHGAARDLVTAIPSFQLTIDTMKETSDIFDETICVSKDAALQYKDTVGTDSRVIYNLLNPDIIELANEPIEYDTAELMLTTVCRLSPEKGFDRIHKIAKQLQNAKKDFIWYIVGGGLDTSFTSKLFDMFKDIPQCRFVGKKSNPFPYMKIANFNMLLSNYESYGLVIAEAAMLGIPSITTDFTCAKEVVRNNGFVIKKDLSDFDIDMLYTNVKVTDKLLDNREEWLKIL